MLLSSVHGSLGIYFMSIFFMPFKVKKTLDSIELGFSEVTKIKKEKCIGLNEI